MAFHYPDIERGSAAGVPARRGSREEPDGAESELTSASDWHRAGIAVSGVTLVLVIAAGIHFIAPPARDFAEQQSALARPLELVDPDSPRVAGPSAIDPGAIEQPTGTASVPRVARPRRTDRPPQRAIDERSSAWTVDSPRPMAPVVAALEIPEERVQLEPMRLSVSKEFAEVPLPTLSGAPANGDEAARGDRRDPVTAAFVTAGRSVAGGFKSAGRAMKRVF